MLINLLTCIQTTIGSASTSSPLEPSLNAPETSPWKVQTVLMSDTNVTTQAYSLFCNVLLATFDNI